MLTQQKYRGGFALPTVLIASVVMLTVLAVAVSSVAAVRMALKTQQYEQLAKVAGEAGVAYANACLAKNNNIAQWTTEKPLRPNTDCTGTPLPSLTCPESDGCYVTVNDTLRSSFSVTAPSTDTEGRALTLPHTGFVELIRASDGQVWRTYRQPAVQATAVPDLCSGAATSGLGWSNAVLAASEDRRTITAAPTALTITLAASSLPAGNMYFQRDFTVNEAGTYTVWGLSNNPKDRVELYVGKTMVTYSQGMVNSGSITLPAGCHTMTARLTNRTAQAAPSLFTAAITQPGATAPIVGTDTSWRVSSGLPVSFSSADFYADPSVWSRVTNYSTAHAISANSAWSVASDSLAAMISPSGSGCPSSCPGNATAYMRDSKDFYLDAETEVTISTICDDACGIYIDGIEVIKTKYNADAPWNDVIQITKTLEKGYHHLGIRLYNAGASASSSGAVASVVNRSSGVALARSDTSWLATGWIAGNVSDDILSYEASFRPSPKNIADSVVADVLVVGGGGGGGAKAAGGGGAGGVRFVPGYELEVATYSVSVGAGGVGASSATVPGSSGSFSSFGTLYAAGGGGGASSDGGSAGVAGASGGGGAGSSTPARTTGGVGATAAGIGNAGGRGALLATSTTGTGGGGGGAGNVGMAGEKSVSAGDGGAGQIFFFSGVRLAVGGGGGGGVASSGSVGSATDGGGVGVVTGTGASGAAQTGGGGGGGGTAGGSGGSGVVVVRIKAGVASLTVTGSYAMVTRTIDGVVYQIYTFTGSGTFKVSALFPS